MSWTYEPGASDKDFVRLLIGDTDENNRQLHDEEIQLFLDQNSAVYLAASDAAGAIAALYARQVDKHVGDLRLFASQRQTAYNTLSKDLRRQVGLSVSPSAGGISRSDKRSAEQDSDRVKPAFRRGQFDSPYTINPPGSTGASNGSGWSS